MQKILNFLLVVVITLAINSGVFAETVITQNIEASAGALLSKHVALKTQLMQNVYHRPIFFESMETADTVSSNVYAVLDTPFIVFSSAFEKSDNWCEVLILHLNTKYCKVTKNAVNIEKLAVNVGKKIPQSLNETFLLDFSYRVAAAAPNYLEVRLHAEKGPLNTTAYELQLKAVPLHDGKTFLRLDYSYGYGLAGRLAMQTYLATLARGKVGFSKNSSTPNSDYVGGMRGAVERNTMRYYLAIEAFLASLKQPPAQQVNSRFQHWFDATEEYSLQLHELDRFSYLAMKKNEYQRQQGVPSNIQ